MKLFNFFLLIIIPQIGFSCACSTYDVKKMDSIGYEWSDIVILGNVLVSGENYAYRVRKVLKGSYEENIVYGTAILSTNPNTKEVNDGLFYATDDSSTYLLYFREKYDRKSKTGKDIYWTTVCTGSRKFSYENFPFKLYNLDQENDFWKEIEKVNQEIKQKKILSMVTSTISLIEDEDEDKDKKAKIKGDIFKEKEGMNNLFVFVNVFLVILILIFGGYLMLRNK